MNYSLRTNKNMGTNKMDFEGGGQGLEFGLKYIQNFIRKMWNSSRIKKLFEDFQFFTSNTLVKGVWKHKFFPPFISHVTFSAKQQPHKKDIHFFTR